MNSTVKERIDKYIEQKVGKSVHWSEYEMHKTALFAIVNTNPDEFDYAMKQIVGRMGL